MQIHGIHARALANDIFWGAINRLEKKVTHLDSRVIFPRNASLALGTPGLVFFWQLARDDGAATTPTPRSGAGYRSGSDPRVSLKGHARRLVEWRAWATTCCSPPTTLGRVRSFQTEAEPTRGFCGNVRGLPPASVPDRSGMESSPDIIPRGRVRAFTELFLSARTHGRFPDAVEAVLERSVWLRWFRLVSMDFGFTAMTQGFGSNLCRSSHSWSFPRS